MGGSRFRCKPQIAASAPPAAEARGERATCPLGVVASHFQRPSIRPILHPERTIVRLQPNNQQEEMKRMKLTRSLTKPPCRGSGIAVYNGIPTVDPNTVNLTEMTGKCTVCHAKVKIYQNKSGVRVPHFLYE